ncbi:DNA/RNA non-specific endonuclease, partial [Rathayibacter rathayi]
SHLVSLDGAGAGAADNAAEGFERMRSIAKTQQEAWAAYEATDPGFAQVKNLVAEVNRVVANLGSLTAGQGRSYLPGSFTLTLRTLGELTGGMLEYCRTNQQVASDGWQALFSGYVDDVEADAERQRKEDAVSGLLWDGLQTVAGAVLVAVGVVGTPFSAGVSLALAGLGGSLIAGGVNSAIDHATIASTGEGLNLVGMASQGIGQWYDVTLAQPAIASGDHDLQFLVGAGSGLGDQVSGALQLNMHDTVTGVFTLATNGEAFSQFWNQLTTTAGKAASGDAFVLGQIAGNLLPLGAAAKVTTLDNLLTKTDDLGRLVTKADDLDFGKHVTIAAASDATSAMDWLKNHLGAGRVTVSDEFTPTIRPLDPIDGSTVKSRGGGERESGTPGEKTEVLDPFDPDRQGALLPNVRYRASAPGTNHHYVYETNAEGLIERVIVENLHLKPTGRPRFKHDPNTPGKLPTDDAGHLIADVFDGSPELNNLVSQAKALNRGAGSEWTAMERDWRDALSDVPPRAVTDIEIEILYDGGKRPIALDVKYEIGGKPGGNYFPNPVPNID